MLTAGMALAAVEFVQFVGVHTEAGLKSEPVTGPPTAGPGLWRWLALVVVRGFGTTHACLRDVHGGPEVAPEGSTSTSSLTVTSVCVRTGGVTELRVLVDSSWGGAHTGSCLPVLQALTPRVAAWNWIWGLHL